MSIDGTVTARTADGIDNFDPESRWRLHPSVAVRPEPFGALLYHFGTRRLTFVKDRRLLDAVRAFEGLPTALAACQAAGIDGSEQPSFTAALERLARMEMLVRADADG